MRHHSFPAIDDLIQQAERAAAATPDQVRLVVELVRLIDERGVDPYLLIGTLLEGAVHTLANHIPPERQRETAEQLRRLLVERFKGARVGVGRLQPRLSPPVTRAARAATTRSLWPRCCTAR
jgi:hypothetical protein